MTRNPGINKHLNGWYYPTFFSILIIYLSFLRITEDIICLGDLLEFLLGVGRFVFVRVPFQSLFSVRFFNILISRSFHYPQDFIIIFPHSFPEAGPTLERREPASFWRTLPVSQSAMKIYPGERERERETPLIWRQVENLTAPLSLQLSPVISVPARHGHTVRQLNGEQLQMD